ncbi:MAG: hypothetical protein M3303_02155 [Gemmatimonadota bacterium]|nr:hypothetical protein [Gemmatimonadota bacterium]
MISNTASVGLWLLQQAAAVPDTIVTKAADPGLFAKVAAVASTLMTLALLALAIFLIPAAWNFRQSYKKWNQLLERVYGDINPIMRHGSSIADNVDYITTSIRTDIQQVNATVAAANQRLHQAIAVTEERLNQFSALLEVVQDEAEQLFVSTASAARGVRAGAASLARGAPDAQDPQPLAVDLTAEDLERAAQEDDDGDDDINGAAETQSARPRVRPRARRRDWA